MKANYMEKWRKIGTLFCIATVLGFTACNDDEEEMERFDNNRFYSDYRASNLFENSDVNQNQSFDENEFNQDAFNTWDTDRNGNIDQNEFNRASADFRVNNTNWSTWDADQNGNLNQQEFNAGYASNDFYNTWDADQNGNLSEREFTDGTFNQLDAGGTGQMTAADYNRFNNTYYRF
ncbi:hypothetical protein GCM10027443_09890 [Pontibacter brevis]